MKPRLPGPGCSATERWLFARLALDSAAAALQAAADRPAKQRQVFRADHATAKRRLQKAEAAALAANLDLDGLEQAYAERRGTTAPVERPASTAPIRPVPAREPAGARPVVTRPVLSRPRSVDALTLFDPDTFGRTVWIFPTGSTFHRSDCQTVVTRDSARPVDIADARRHGMARCRHCVPSQWS